MLTVLDARARLKASGRTRSRPTRLPTVVLRRCFASTARSGVCYRRRRTARALRGRAPL